MSAKHPQNFRVRAGFRDGTTPFPPAPPIPDDPLEKVTVNGVRYWMARTPGGHGILLRPDPSIVETPDGTGRATTVPYRELSAGLLDLSGNSGWTPFPTGRRFIYEMTEGWSDAD
jgi:hypothetical protein